MRKITEIAKVVRSKNSSPFELTLDIILKNREEYEKLKAGNVINAKLIAKAYEIPVERIKKVIYFDPAKAIKISMPRIIPSGAPGDTDVYGAQQHGPLLGIEI